MIKRVSFCLPVSFCLTQSDKHLRGQVEKPCQIEAGEQELVQNRAFRDRQIALSGNLQTHHGVTEDEQDQRDRENAAFLKLCRTFHDIHEQIGIIANRDHSQSVCLASENAGGDNLDHGDQQQTDRQYPLAAALQVQGNGVEGLRRQKKHHTPEPLDGGADYQKEVCADGAGESRCFQGVFFLSVQRCKQKAQHNGNKGRGDLQVAAGEYKIIENALCDQKARGQDDTSEQSDHSRMILCLL